MYTPSSYNNYPKKPTVITSDSVVIFNGENAKNGTVRKLLLHFVNAWVYHAASPYKQQCMKTYLDGHVRVNTALDPLPLDPLLPCVPLLFPSRTLRTLYSCLVLLDRVC